MLYYLIKGQNKEECPKFPIYCPNECKAGSTPREGRNVLLTSSNINIIL